MSTCIASIVHCDMSLELHIIHSNFKVLMLKSFHLSFLRKRVLQSACRILDNLPVAVLWQNKDDSKQTFYEHGFKVGFQRKFVGVRVTNPVLHTAFQFFCFVW